MHSVSRWFLGVLLAATFIAASSDASPAKIDIDRSLGARCASVLDGEVCPWNFDDLFPTFPEAAAQQGVRGVLKTAIWHLTVRSWEAELFGPPSDLSPSGLFVIANLDLPGDDSFSLGDFDPMWRLFVGCDPDVDPDVACMAHVDGAVDGLSVSAAASDPSIYDESPVNLRLNVHADLLSGLPLSTRLSGSTNIDLVLSYVYQPVAEPGTLALLGGVLVGLWFTRGRRRNLH